MPQGGVLENEHDEELNDIFRIDEQNQNENSRNVIETLQTENFELKNILIEERAAAANMNASYVASQTEIAQERSILSENVEEIELLELKSNNQYTKLTEFIDNNKQIIET